VRDFFWWDVNLHCAGSAGTYNRARVAAGGASPAPTGRSLALGDVVRAFKSISTIAVNRALRRRGVQLWQRNYYEHIVRNGDDLDNIRQYVFDNPLRWDLDPENPAQPAIP
jgi:putative transposase